MNKIKLNFINKSNDSNNSRVVIFQKNVATDFDEIAVAWTVIQNCGLNEHHPFTYSEEVTVDASDAWGNFSPQLPAPSGTAVEMIKNASGDALVQSAKPAVNHAEIEIRNQLMQGAINGNVYRDGRLCAVKTGIAPGQKAVFQFKPTIWIGVASEIEEGDIMNAAIISAVNTELSLLGIASADIVMTGGGPGPSATPFQFSLENVVMV